MAAQQLTAPDHVWMHFSQLGPTTRAEVPVFVRGEGVHLYDSEDRRYFDALSSLYCVNVGHGRREIATAMARQAEQLAYVPVWDRLHPPAMALASRLASLAPGQLTRVFFTSGGSESIDAAVKLMRQYHRLRGKRGKTKIVSRLGAYHGTTLGALGVTAIPSLKEPFEPVVPGGVHAPKVDAFHADCSPLEHSIRCADAMADLVDAEGPDTVGAIVVEPVQNSGGCLVAEPPYFQRLREICDIHDLLLISDETICSFGRLGTYFGCQALGYEPDVITTAKGLTSGYAPMGAVIASDRVVEPFLEPGASFNHGLTFGGHPVAAAAALANLDILADERLCETAGSVGAAFRAELETLLDLPIVGDVRGIGMFQAIELVSDKPSRAGFTPEQIAELTTRVPSGVFEAGIICRALHRGAPTLQFAPPLVATPQELAEMVGTIRSVLMDAAEALA